jgi:hypothetical protein
MTAARESWSLRRHEDHRHHRHRRHRRRHRPRRRHEAQPWKSRGRSHATRAGARSRDGAATLYVEGVGHRLPRGYEIHWNWTARRGGKKIDGGALTGGDIPEFYETWPDPRGQAAIVQQMTRILRDEWIAAGEFGTLKLSPKVSVTLRKSSSDVPIRGR